MKNSLRKLVSACMATITAMTLVAVPLTNENISVAASGYAAESYSAGIYKVSHRSGVNVRKSAKNGKVRGAAAKGVEFYVSKVSGSWGYTDSISTTSGTKSGWVCLDYCDKLAYGDIEVTGHSFTTDSSGYGVVSFTFSGVGISNVKASASNVDSAYWKECTWNSYPNDCTAEFYVYGAENGSVTLYLYADDGSVIGQATARAKNNSDKYDEGAAIAFAQRTAYTNKSWLCAEYASRVIREGGIPIDVYKGCTQLFKRLQKLEDQGYGTIHKLNIRSNGTARWSDNRGIVSEGDIIIMYCPSCINYDGYPYVHAVIAGEEDRYSSIGVYAHNNAHSDEDVYYGFNYCSVHGSCSDNAAYVFHFN